MKSKLVLAHVKCCNYLFNADDSRGFNGSKNKSVHLYTYFKCVSNVL